MKIRNGFVSNSSSSSFVIAVKRKSTVSSLKKVILETKKDDLQYFLDNLLPYCSDLEEEIDGLDNDEQLSRLANFIADGFYYSYMVGLDIEDWHVSADEFGNEGDDFSMIMYEIGSIDTDILKVKSFS